MSLLSPRPSVEAIVQTTHSDIAFLGQRLWDKLSSDSHAQRIYLSATSNQHYASTGLSTISFCAQLDEKTEHLAVPQSWSTLYKRVFSPKALSVLLTLQPPITITEIVISALTMEAYEMAPQILDSWLCDGRILRQGDVCTFTSDSLVNGSGSHSIPPLQYRLDMLDPVMQGCARKGETKFILTLDITSHPDESDGESDVEGFEIGQDFLAPSIFNSSQVAASPTQDHKPVLFECRALTESNSSPYEDCTLYLRTTELGRVGGLNGDWLVVHSVNSRLVRVVADDTLVTSNGIVHASPVLIHNICPSLASSSPRTLSLHPSPFGSGQPAIPTAKAITIARVASPISVDRAYQPSFLRSLKAYFNGSKRLIKNGDIIAVPVDTDSPSDDNESSLDGELKSVTPERADEVVFFMITNVEHDVLPTSEQLAEHDTYLDSTMGELGCWVDPSATRIIQTGVEHARVPDIGTYLHPDRNSPRALFSALNRGSDPILLRPDSPYGRLVSLCSATLLRDAVDYNLSLSVLLKGARGTGKFTTACWVAHSIGMHILEINCYDLIGETDIKTEGTLRARFEKLEQCSPCILLLRHIDGLAQTTQALEPGKESVLTTVLRECIDNMHNTWRISGHPAMVFATTAEAERVPMGMLSCFKHEVAFEAPNEGERLEMLQSLLADTVLSPDVSLAKLATETAALVAGDIASLVLRAQSISLERASRISNSSEIAVMTAGVATTAADFENALDKARVAYSESIGAPKIPNVSWDDVGGLATVKNDILDTIQLPLDHPELFADGLKKRSGILLYGPPGTGKTLLAKAVATSCSLNFFSVKGPELLNMYIGESEANVRRVFQRARDAKPCVIFFDELDSVAPKRGNHGDSGGVMDRIVSQLLAELDGMAGGSSGADVFVIGATNRPDLLDPALLRPGRFDRMLYLGVSDTHEAQLNILTALTRKFRLDPALDLARLAEQCPFNYTGADFYALCSDAMLNAMSRKAEALEAKLAVLNSEPAVTGKDDHPRPLTSQYYLAELASPEDIDVLVSEADFDRALKNLVPSVSQSEMEHYAHIQQRFSRPESSSSASEHAS